ncbi:MAG: hypothetical protein IJ484_05260, partial [Oscillospiraceae bacterium]|nr:hypothetical protein [Oscillospiraceae bacterium]
MAGLLSVWGLVCSFLKKRNPLAVLNFQGCASTSQKIQNSGANTRSLPPPQAAVARVAKKLLNRNTKYFVSQGLVVFCGI